jgi:predicted transcriptional regulator
MFRGKAYEEKIKECRGAVRSFLDNFYKENEIRALEWDAEQDILLLPEIIKYAKFLSKLRGSLMTWKSDDRTTYEYSFPIVEEPPRAINSLYNLAKGHALINGRKFLKGEDIEIVKAVCFSSMPHDRSEFLKLLSKHEGKLTTKQIERELNCSQDTALRTMKTFEILGVVKIKSLQIEADGTGRPMNYIEINPEFDELLDFTQGINDEIKP